MSFVNRGPRFLDSRFLVQDWQAAQRERVVDLGGLWLRVVMAKDAAGVTNRSAESFGQRVETHGNEVRAEVRTHRELPQDLAGRLTCLGADPYIDGVLLARPLPPDGEYLAGLSRRQDIDQARGDSPYPPALMTGLFHLVDRALPDLAEHNIVVAGAGGTVGSQIVKELAARGIQATGIDPKFGHTDDDLRTAIGQADTLFTAMRQPGTLTADWFPDGMTVFDATVEPVPVGDKVQIWGDVHRSVYEADIDITLNRVPGVVGPLATCGLFDNGIAAAQVQMESLLGPFGEQ